LPEPFVHVYGHCDVSKKALKIPKLQEQNIPPIPDETRLGMVTEMATLGIARILCGQVRTLICDL
jgi:hypothetical protein